MICLSATGLEAQSDSLSARLTVIAGRVFVQRAGTAMELPLDAGAVAPLGAGDRIRTESDNARALISFPDSNSLLLLPDTSYSLLAFGISDTGQYYLDGYLQGIAVQQFEENKANWHYTLRTSRFSVTAPSDLFAVWGISDDYQAVISAHGTLAVEEGAEHKQITVPENAGVFVPYDEVLALGRPLHAAQLLGFSVACRGVVDTGGSEGLRLRGGAALDYPVLDAVYDKQEVYIVGTTENGLWYRVPFETGFGWQYSRFIQANCSNLPQFPNLVGEHTEHIQNVTSFELELLEPFYGEVATNRVFYR